MEGRRKKEEASLPWKDVTPDDPLAIFAGSSQGGFMCLEEVDGSFYLQYSNNASKLVAAGDLESAVGGSTKHKSDKKRRRSTRNETKRTDSGGTGDNSTLRVGTAKTKKRRKLESSECGSTTSNDEIHSIAQTGTLLDEKSFDSLDGKGLEMDLVDGCKGGTFLNEKLFAWAELRLNEKILKALSVLNFIQPTPIQKACIPVAAHQGKDVIGAAETGSGKTLAYVIPILQRLLDEEEKYCCIMDKDISFSNFKENKGFLRALILTPTRELALQVCKHFKEAAKFTTIKMVAIVGGLSLQKQERLLKKRPDAVVGTPGRLWELMSAGDQHLTELNHLSFLVLDEADRMIEKGHFQELQSIMGLLPIVDHKEGSAQFQSNSSRTDSGYKGSGGSHRRQSFVFSATLALPTGFRKKLKKGNLFGKQQPKGDEYSVAFLSERAGVRSNAAIVNLTSQNIVSDKLEESIIQCREEEKDFFLYYLLKLHGLGRTIIFCTSIAAVRHVVAVLGLLEVQAWPLHAQMQQKQRLKHMDRFQSREDSCLISTDVAARGLDIPGVRTVIHYQLPHSAEIYVHRSGRTARASKDGCSILLVTPSDQTKFISLINTLSKTALPLFPCNNAYIPAVMKRVQLAQKIDALLRKTAQARVRKIWFKRHAEALELDIQDEGIDGETDSSVNLSEKQRGLELKRLQQELRTLLEEPIEPKAFSHRFITGAGISPLLAGQLKDYTKQKPHKEQKFRAMKSTNRGPEREKRRLVVIGQEMVEPLDALRSSKT